MTMTRDEKRQVARKLADAGKTLTDISAVLDVPVTTLYGWIPDAPDKPQLKRALELREKGMTYQEIGYELGVNKQRVAKLLGPVPRTPTSGDRRQIEVSTGTWERVETVARDLGLIVQRGRYTGKGSVAMLLDAIGAGHVSVAWTDGYRASDPLDS